MYMDQKSKYCQQCQRKTLWARPETNFLLHMLITLVTCGFWLPIALLLCTGGWRCQTCGADGFEDPAEDSYGQPVMGRVKFGLIGGAFAGFVGLVLSSSGSSGIGLGMFVVFGVIGLLAGAAIGPYYERYYG